jgi:nucleoside phosphorylase
MLGSAGGLAKELSEVPREVFVSHDLMREWVVLRDGSGGFGERGALKEEEPLAEISPPSLGEMRPEGKGGGWSGWAYQFSQQRPRKKKRKDFFIDLREMNMSRGTQRGRP